MSYDIKLPIYRVSLAISNLKKRRNDRNKDNKNDYKPTKRNYLLVPDKSTLTENIIDLKNSKDVIGLLSILS